MPKQVDPQQRRELIAAALLKLAARQGLQAVSLRQVASEAGVTAGMVQHYFSSKEEMMRFAMQEASKRYETRMNVAFAQLGEHPTPKQTVQTLLTTLLPLEESERDDARVALAFQAYAATNENASKDLNAGDDGMRSFIEQQLRVADRTTIEPGVAAAALLGTVEGLGMHVLSSKLPPEQALLALEAQVEIFFGPDPQ